MLHKEQILKAAFSQMILAVVIVFLTLTVSKYFKYFIGVVFLNLTVLFFKFISLHGERDRKSGVMKTAMHPFEVDRKESRKRPEKSTISMARADLSLKESTLRAGISDLTETKKGFEQFIVKHIVPLSDHGINDSVDSLDTSSNDLLRNIARRGFSSYDKNSADHRRVMYHLLRKVFGERDIVVEHDCMVYCYVNREFLKTWGDPVLAYLFMICCAVKNGNEWFDKKDMHFIDGLLP